MVQVTTIVVDDDLFNILPSFCSVDATAETGRPGRLINHSKTGNATVKIFQSSDGPKLIIEAKEQIKPNTEVLFDYGDHSKRSTELFPWLLS